MKQKLLLAMSLVVVFIGCGQQPELDVNAEQNKTVEKKADANTSNVNGDNMDSQTVSKNQPVETDLTDNVTDVTENSLEDKNQKLAKSLSENVVHFDFDKYNIKNSQLSVVENVANKLKDANTNYTVRIEGNCDEWGSDEYNYALGLKRAKVVKKALVNLGVDSDKLTIISYGESNPVCTAHNKDCWAKNRRDNFTLLP